MTTETEKVKVLIVEDDKNIREALRYNLIAENYSVTYEEDGINALETILSEEFDVIYSCLRCNTKVSSSELGRLPEIKCICGFRVFTKVRPPIVKSIKAI